MSAVDAPCLRTKTSFIIWSAIIWSRATFSENYWYGSNVNFRNFKAILTMQRHRHNVKVSKLLVWLRPCQTLYKTTPIMMRSWNVRSQGFGQSSNYKAGYVSASAIFFPYNVFLYCLQGRRRRGVAGVLTPALLKTTENRGSNLRTLATQFDYKLNKKYFLNVILLTFQKVVDQIRRLFSFW